MSSGDFYRGVHWLHIITRKHTRMDRLREAKNGRSGMALLLPNRAQLTLGTLLIDNSRVPSLPSVWNWRNVYSMDYPPVTDKLLQEVVHSILSVGPPQKIVLFGSQAREEVQEWTGDLHSAP
jgi:hypothetical protein